MEASKARLETWSYDGESKLFSGLLYGHKHFPDGTHFTTSANFVDWPARYITVGSEVIELGGSREELNNDEEPMKDGTPW